MHTYRCVYTYIGGARGGRGGRRGASGGLLGRAPGGHAGAGAAHPHREPGALGAQGGEYKVP